MSSSLLDPLPLNPEFYASWKKERHLLQLAMNIPPARRAPAEFLSLNGQACAVLLEMDVALFHSDGGINKLIKKLDTLFQEDKNQSAFICYEYFESYLCEPHISINGYLIEFERYVLKLREFQIILPEPVLAYCALKFAKSWEWGVNQSNNY